MITGHFGLAAGVKKFAPRLPLWSLLIATFWLDIIFMILSMFGLESFTSMDPARPAYGEVIINAQYTHSLIGAILISILTGWLAGLHWEKKGGMVIGLVVFSHWILDLLVHRPDLPILPGNVGSLPLLGLGLWQYPRLSGVMELVLAIGGTTLYWVGTAKLKRDQRRRAVVASAVTGTLLLVLFLSNIFGL
jgi:membrane-bound metal-dependent hydrolase YbcI (DUF457 family)